jgi:hypothetical protein
MQKALPLCRSSVNTIPANLDRPTPVKFDHTGGAPDDKYWWNKQFSKISLTEGNQRKRCQSQSYERVEQEPFRVQAN